MRLRLARFRQALPVLLSLFAALVVGQSSSEGIQAIVDRSRASPSLAAGTVILPPGYDASESYPVVEFLPASGATSAALLEHYIWDVNSGAALAGSREAQLAALLSLLFPTGTHAGRDFVLVLAAVQGSSKDYSTGEAWGKTLERYEKQVQADVAALASSHKIDTTRVFMAGFSLGADIAWALALRNPTTLHGAIIMSSRASYRVPTSAYLALARAKPRFFLTISGAEDATRVSGARSAAQLLKAIGLSN